MMRELRQSDAVQGAGKVAHEPYMLYGECGAGALQRRNAPIG